MNLKEERLQAAIAGELADRPPVALWRHFPVDDQDPILLAEATHAYQNSYDFDFIKVTPASSFCIKDYGAKDEWRGKVEGTRDYIHWVVNSVDDWRLIDVLDPEAGSLGAQLDCLAHLQDKLGGETPFIQTIFNPLSQAKNLVGPNRLLVHLRQSPEIVLEAFDRITQTTIAFIEYARNRGIAGIFYAIQFGSYEYFSEQEYAQFGEPFDKRILDAAEGLWLNVLHLHGDNLIFDLARKYPVQVVNWHDRETEPDLAQGKSQVAGAVCGGLRRWDTMVLGDADTVKEEASDALRSLDGGRGMILGTGCVVPTLAPYGNFMAAREIVESFSRS
jgi:uroporphyrinogen decarboxylase